MMRNRHVIVPERNGMSRVPVAAAAAVTGVLALTKAPRAR